MKSLHLIDPEIDMLIQQENQRQSETLNFIASENYASAAVREACSSSPMNKYAEGYPNKRYYAGCTTVDAIEQLAIDRCKTLFGAEAANVQPNAGSSANFAAYAAILQPGDTILGMSLAHGGHLTHGHFANASGTLYRSISYGVHPETELIDYEQVARLAEQHRPKVIIAGASAYSRIIDFEKFAAIAKAYNAYLMADIAHIAGLVAAGIHPSPVGHADLITSTTHKTLRGPRGGIILSTATLGEAVNRAIMPGTQGGPFMNIIAAKAVCFAEAMMPEFKAYQHRIVETARQMAQTLQGCGYRIVSGGTDNHLFIIDLQGSKHTGLTAQKLLEQIGITVSRSCIPNDPQKPWVTSGIRIGTPPMATRNMDITAAQEIALLIDEALRCEALDERKLAHLAAEVKRWALQLSLSSSRQTSADQRANSGSSIATAATISL